MTLSRFWVGFIAVVAISAVLSALLIRDYKDFSVSSAGLKASIINISPGENITGVLKRLKLDTGLTKIYWRFLLRLSPELSKIRAGEFEVDQELTPRQFLFRLSKGSFVQHRFTIIEGWTFKQLREEMSHIDELRLNGLSNVQIKEALGIEGPIEGQFPADTYFYQKGLSGKGLGGKGLGDKGQGGLLFLKRANNRLKDIMAKLWPGRALGLPYETQRSALILASIVEKETQLPSERVKVSGVFNLRLHKKMRLQADPTVIYGMGENYDGNIRRKDLRTDTPYNTYTRKGLPPGPICLVGEAALNAAMQPSADKSLYFVADGTGGHLFSDTLPEHQKKVQAYVKALRVKNKRNKK